MTLSLPLNLESFYAFCKYTSKESDLNTFQIFSAEEACTVWCQKRNGGTKSRGWTFPDGTACQTHRNRYSKPSYCINGRCEVCTILLQLTKNVKKYF